MTEKMSDQEWNALRREIDYGSIPYQKKARPVHVRKRAGGIYSFVVQCPSCAKTIEYNNIALSTSATIGFKSGFLFYPFWVICRNCYMYFAITNLVYDIYISNRSRLRILAKFYLRLLRYAKKIVYSFQG